MKTLAEEIIELRDKTVRDYEAGVDALLTKHQSQANAGAIQDGLENLSKTHPGVDGNVVSRIRTWVNRINNTNGGRLEIEDPSEAELQAMSKEQRASYEKARAQRLSGKPIAMPGFVKAIAQYNGKPVEMTLEVVRHDRTQV